MIYMTVSLEGESGSKSPFLYTFHPLSKALPTGGGKSAQLQPQFLPFALWCVFRELPEFRQVGPGEKIGLNSELCIKKHMYVQIQATF